MNSAFPLRTLFDERAVRRVLELSLPETDPEVRTRAETVMELLVYAGVSYALRPEVLLEFLHNTQDTRFTVKAVDDLRILHTGNPIGLLTHAIRNNPALATDVDILAFIEQHRAALDEFADQGDNREVFQSAIVWEDLDYEALQQAIKKATTRDEMREAELRQVAATFMQELLDQNVPDQQLFNAAYTLAGTPLGVRDVIEEMQALKAEVLQDAQRERLPVAPELIQSEIQTLIDALTDIKDDGYAVGYLVPELSDPAYERDFVNAVGRFATADQVPVTGGKVSSHLRNGLASLGKYPRPVHGQHRNLVLPGHGQEYAGLVAPGQYNQGIYINGNLIPITAARIEEQAPLVAKYVIVLQTAVALLLAHEVRSEEQRKLILLNPAALLKNYNLVPAFENQVIQTTPNGLQISTVAVRAYLEWRAAQQIQAAA